MKNGLRLQQEKMTPNKETLNMRMVQGVLVFITLLVLSGCWDIDEADRMNYVHGIGIDYVDEEIVIYLQIPNMGSLGSPDVTSEVETNVVIVQEQGQNISSIIDRKSTRLNSSHVAISYAVFCLKKKISKLMYLMN